VIPVPTPIHWIAPIRYDRPWDVSIRLYDLYRLRRCAVTALPGLRMIVSIAGAEQMRLLAQGSGMTG